MILDPPMGVVNGLVLDVEVIRDQLLNILLAARDTVSHNSVLHLISPGYSFRMWVPDDSFVVSRGIPFRRTS